MEDVIISLLPAVLTFVVGYLLKSPIYQNAKKIAGLVVKALEDDKLSSEEIEAIYNAIKSK